MANTTRGMPKWHSYPQHAIRGMPKGIHTVDLAHAALIWLNTKSVFSVDLAKCLKTNVRMAFAMICSVDFLIWRIRPSALDIDLAMNCATTNGFFLKWKWWAQRPCPTLKIDSL